MRKAALAITIAACLAAPAPALSAWFGPTVDPELVAQVPQDKRGGIDKADFELAVAGEEVALAKLKEELADRQQDLAELGTKLAKAQQKRAELALDLARIEAVDAQGLGKKAENVKILGEVRADLTKNEAERIQLKSKLDQTELFIRDLTQRVAAKEKSVGEFRTRRSGAAQGGASSAPAVAPAKPAPAPAPQPAPPASAKPITEVVKETPSPAAPPAAKDAKEGDLKN